MYKDETTDNIYITINEIRSFTVLKKEKLKTKNAICQFMTLFTQNMSLRRLKSTQKQ